jgi:hypothetical protein
MRRYRYRTSVLVGPWRETPERATADAVRSRQARIDEDGEFLTWVVPGRIEAADDESEGEAAPSHY